MKIHNEEKSNMYKNCLKYGFALAATSVISMPVMAEYKVDTYASIRGQVESVSVDEAKVGEDDSFVGVRDAFSRFGAKASYDLSADSKLSAKIEVPFNIGNFNAEDPTYFDDNSVRVAKLAANGSWGNLWVGKDWLPYYNNVAWPVDLFSSFYSGWATYARFREYAAVYTTPSLAGFKLTASAIELDDSQEEGNQYVLSYSHGGFTLAYAKEVMDDANESSTGDTEGVAISYSGGPFYVAVKGEEFTPVVGGSQVISNLYASYKFGEFTVKGMVADGDEGHWAPGATGHVGLDYQHSDSVKLFAEYFSEENAYAILKTDAQSYDTLGVSGSAGQAFLVGARYDI